MPLTNTTSRSATSYPPQLCEEYATLWLNAMTNRNMPSTTRNGNTSLGRVGSSVLQSNASVFQPAMSKKHVKEAENELHVGGLRRPIQSLYMVPGWEATGRRLWDCIDASLCNDMNASLLTRLYGQADFQGPPLELVEKVQNAILKEFALEPVATIKPPFGLPSTVRADILCGVMRVANDPDADTIQDWLVHGAPLGMDRKIETTGVFPPADNPDREDDSPTPDVSEQLTVGGGHYKSVLENSEDAHKEFDRYRAAQIAVDIDKTTLERLFPKGHINKLGLIIKESPEKRKVRLVVDMRRSKANARAAVPERPILPRPCDVVADWKELFLEAVSLGFTSKTDVVCENVTCDFSDAYCHVLVHPDELKNCLVAAPPSPSGSDQEIAMMCRMGFGSKGAPLTWCRIAAALGRAAQAMLGGARWSGHAAGRINTYIDDPLLNLLGTQEQRDKQLQAVLLFWTAAGFKVAWAKGTRSKVAKWIGLEFTSDFQSQTVTVRIPAKTADAFKQDAQKLLSAPMIPLKMLRQLAGKGGWIMNLLPKAGWTIQRLW